MWEKGQKDLNFLEMVANMETSMVANKLGITTNAVNLRIFGIRQRIARYQWYLNNIYNLQKKSPRIRKLTTRGAVEKEDDEDLEEW